MRIAIGADHGGVHLKEEIVKYLQKEGYEYQDFGTFDTQAVDYPNIAFPVANAVRDGRFDTGILICGTGIGMSITANKVPGIRCALLGDVFSAKATRAHNDANMMALGERVTGPGLALEIVDAFLHTPFSGEERHARRVAQIAQIESTQKNQK